MDDESVTVLCDFIVEYAWAGAAEEAQGASSSMYGSSSLAPTSSPTSPRSPSPNPRELGSLLAVVGSPSVVVGSPSAMVGSPSVVAPTSPAPQLTSLTSTSPQPISPADQLTSSTSSTSPVVTPAHAGQPDVEYAILLEDDEDCLDAYYDNEPLRCRTVASILGDQSSPD